MPQNYHLAFVCVLSCLIGNARADWPQFRGLNGDGVATQADPPIRWNAKENSKWSVDIAGKGWSSPVVLDNQVWVTTAVEHKPTETQIKEQQKKTGLTDKQFAQRNIAGSLTLRAICLDAKTGKAIHDLELFHVESPDAIHTLNSYASPTPYIEKGRVYIHFGANGTACVDTRTGEVVWSRAIPLFHSVGAGSSPEFFEDLLILVCDGVHSQFVIALDKGTGETVWKTPRPEIRNTDGEHRKAFSTPLLIHRDGQPQLISIGAQWLVSYDPRTGKEIWRVDHGAGFSNVARPIFADGVVYVSTGFGKPELWAVRVDGTGDVSGSHVLWKETSQIPAKPSPLIYDGKIYVLSDSGILTCLNAKDGKSVWRERIGGNYSASPALIGKQVYLMSHEGTVTVFAPGAQYKELAKFELEEQIMASPAVAGDDIILRAGDKLSRVGK
ncbi:MAG: outer membrane protein assembly factor BamB [Pirellulaceae bacterium]|jgi:outer membrane protein assembly factor BamB